jgi:cell division protein FtsI (penicillin-binding protein 3)
MLVKEFEPEISNPMICSKSTLLKAKKMLRDVVVYGTAKDINTNKYEISGKTGTTEHYDVEKRKHTEEYRASFVPDTSLQNNPKYSIMVVINKPQINYYGALAAAPVFKKIADKIFTRDRDINPPVSNTGSKKIVPYSKNGFRDRS